MILRALLIDRDGMSRPIQVESHRIDGVPPETYGEARWTDARIAERVDYKRAAIVRDDVPVYIPTEWTLAWRVVRGDRASEAERALAQDQRDHWPTGIVLTRGTRALVDHATGIRCAEAFAIYACPPE